MTMTFAPVVGRSQFRARNTWIGGTHSSSSFDGWSGPGEERRHPWTLTVDADQPVGLGGEGIAPAPVEFMLHALAACLTAGVATAAAARGIRLTAVHSEVTGGVEAVNVRFTVHGEASAAQLRAVVDEARDRSPVHGLLAAAVPILVHTIVR